MPDGIVLRSCDEEAGLIAPEAALARILAGIAPVAPVETCAIADCAGRILAEPVVAQVSLPPFDAAAMDGFALTACGLDSGGPLRVVARIAAGEAPCRALRKGEAARVLTGAPVPAGTAAVVMEEHARLRGDRLEVLRQAERGQNIRRRGEDVRPGMPALPPGLRLGARHVALLAALGVAQVPVRRRLRVGVLSNGNELHGGAVRDSNRPMLLALLRAAGAEASDLGLVRDDAGALATALRDAAAQADLIVTSGGISGSDADHLAHALRRAGGVVETLHLAQKPGKPLAHGCLGAARCLLLPGNPVAAFVAMTTLGLPLLSLLAGEDARPARLQPGVMAQGLRRRAGRCEYRPARILGADALGRPVLEPLGRGGSASLLPLGGADGLLRIAAETAWLPAGAAVGFLPFPAGG
ncbi:gephyrin-like molybdotransferase Glp [Roseomonas sp. AR75]|uniref:molybdopterin molybdotransferase MoeA n=1 Tax=Roseomonas sp. AR75 TaxID=2562311 RepID=UPI0010C0EF24|nr:gephyrin-like molybdotransferase Glp [Roseomonas sp. AR75]